MEEFKFKVYPVSSLIDKSDLDNYSCGVTLLDQFVKTEYKDLERMHLANLTSVYMDNRLVGMYALSAGSSSSCFADSNRQKIFGESSSWKVLPMISLDHLSVSSQFQHGNSEENWKMGTSILKHIFRMLLNIGAEYGVAFAGVMVDSLPDPVEFYMKNGFYFIDKEQEYAINRPTYTLAINYDDMLKAYD